ncbi:MAG: hypothetical protein ACI9N9_000602 [Enterobacterales bacterium]|jgi:hypothetical protein
MSEVYWNYTVFKNSRKIPIKPYLATFKSELLVGSEHRFCYGLSKCYLWIEIGLLIVEEF